MDYPPLFLNNCLITEVSLLKILSFLFDSSFTWEPHIDMIVSKAKLWLAQLYPYLDFPGLSIMYKSFIRSCLEYGHLFYFSAARSHLEHLNALQCRAAGICYDTFPSLESRQYAAAVGLTCRLLDGKGRGSLQSFCPHFITSFIRRSFCLNDLSNLPRAYRLHNPITFRSLDSFHRSWHAVISTVWDTLPASLLLQGHNTGLHSVSKDLQCCCYQ